MWFKCIAIIIYTSVCVRNAVCVKSSLFELTVVHLNDFHARFEETSPDSTRCTADNCIGGFSRLYHAAHKLVKTRPNAIFLNAGDNFQGTLWYNIYRWNVTQYFLNKLPTDAYTLGNHDFDDNIDGVVPFINALKAPVVVANIDDSDEPSIQGTYQKSTIIIRNGRRIGVVGVILSTTDNISSPGKLKFKDEIESVNKEANHLVTVKNCSIVIVLSHCGVEVDVRIAKAAGPHIGLIVGGHSHTFLYSGDNPPGPEVPKGPYPIVVTHKDGRHVLVVQASFNTKYLGNLSVWYDDNGDVKKWEGNPVFLAHEQPQDPHINNEIEEWKASIDEYGNTVLGNTKVLLDRSTRRTGESNIGSFFADAMVDYYVDMAEENHWTYASIAIINSGAIRTSILPGNITVYDIVASQPFDNTVDCVELTGRDLKDILEYSVTPSAVRTYQFHEFLQISGLRVVFDTKHPIGSRVIRLKVLCSKCEVPVYSDVIDDQIYRVLMLSFLVDGGDGYTIISNRKKNHIKGNLTLDVYAAYITKFRTITKANDERIILRNSATIQDSVEYNTSSTVNRSYVTVALYSVGFLFCLNFNYFI